MVRTLWQIPVLLIGAVIAGKRRRQRNHVATRKREARLGSFFEHLEDRTLFNVTSLIRC